MARRKSSDDDKPRRKPATTPEERENQVISGAYDLAEEQILGGTASSQVITHFLKLGSSRERLEQQRLEYENKLTQVKIESMASQARVEELYTKALDAMRSYSGQGPPPSEDDEE